MKKYLIIIVGILMLGIGFYFVKTLSLPQGIMRTIPYILIGVGCGMFGHGMGELLQKKAMKNSPEIAERIEIEENDERNLAIGRMAKAKAYDMMVFVFGALMLTFAIMQIDLTAILLLVSAYLFVIFYGVYYRIKYDKTM